MGFMDVFGTPSMSEPRYFARELSALQTRLRSLPSAYDLPQGMDHQECGREVGRQQELQKQEMREMQHALDILFIEIKLAEVNFKIEQSRSVTKAALRENEFLKREKTQ